MLSRWHELERHLSIQGGIDSFIESSIKVESKKWRQILRRIVIHLLGERSLAFQEDLRSGLVNQVMENF